MRMVYSHQPHSLKEKQRREREALILQAAEEVLMEKGYYETSMDEIAARVGVAKGTIYAHFPGKEELVFALFQRNLRQFTQGIDAVIAVPSTPSARLEALMLYMHTGFYSQQAKLAARIYNGVDLKRLLLDRQGCMREQWDHVLAKVMELIEQGKATGEFKEEIPSHVMALTFFSICSPHTYDHLLLLGGGELDQDVARSIWQVYFRGISK